MTVDTSLHKLLSLEGVTLPDIESLRLILQGGSIIDWHRLNLPTPEAVQQFLRVNCHDPDSPHDQLRLRHLLSKSVRYLERNFRYHFPPQLAEPEHVEDLFVLASGKSEFQNLACILLKVMQILNHVDAGELKTHLSVSEDVLLRRAEDAVTRTVQRLQKAGAPIVSFVSSRKSRDSLITKLLAKKTTVATQVYDLLRFRIITRTPLDLVPVLTFLKNELLPFNYVVPGQSRNEILKIHDVLQHLSPAVNSRLEHTLSRLQLEDVSMEEENRFSAANYRMISFVVDLPLRVDDLIDPDDPGLSNLGFLVFYVVEFQMFDEQTDVENQQGDSSHESYKDRQRWEVIRRLVYGSQLSDAGGPAHGRTS